MHSAWKVTISYDDTTETLYYPTSLYDRLGARRAAYAWCFEHDVVRDGTLIKVQMI